GPTRSPETSARQGAAAPASAPWSRLPACARHAGERQASPRDRAGTASCGSRRGLRASASREDAGSRTGDAHARSPSSAPEPRGRRDGWSRSEPSCGSSRWLYTPAVRSSRRHPSGERQLSAWPRASPFLSHEILQRRIVEHGVGQQTLQTRVLVLQRLQPARLRDVHPAEAGLPVVDRGVADPVLAAQVGDRNPGLVLLQYSDDLLFREATALHVLVLSIG